jgi:hypothetical protein
MATRFPRRTPDGPVLSLDLGGTNARAAVVTPDGRVVVRRASATPMGDGLPVVLELCLSLLRDARDQHLAEGGPEPVAVGIAAPGPLDPRRGVLIDPPNMRGDWWDSGWADVGEPSASHGRWARTPTSISSPSGTSGRGKDLATSST